MSDPDSDMHEPGNTPRQSWLVAALAALFFLPFLGGVHLFDWDEINFAEIAREMIVRGDYLKPHIDYQPFFQKPPLFIWLQALSMQLFGVGEMAARLPNALCGILTLVLLYRFGARLYNPLFGWLWAGAYLGSVLPFLYFKSGIIDPWFNLFIFLGVYHMILYYWKIDGIAFPLRYPARYYQVMTGLFIGLAILTKGPVAYLLAALIAGVYWLYENLRFYIPLRDFAWITVIALGTTLLWFVPELLLNGPAFIKEFTVYQVRLFSTADAGHRGFLGYHVVVLLFGCFPASIFALRALFNIRKEYIAPEEKYQNDFRRWMRISFWVVLVLFSIVGTKIVHYSSLAYFPITYLSAWTLYQLKNGSLSFGRRLRWGLLSIGGVYILLILILPWLGKQAENLKPLFKDPFAQANLDANVLWTGLESLPAFFLAAVLFFSVRAFSRKQVWKGFRLLFGGSALFVFMTLIAFVKRVEGYSQRAAIEFFESKANEDCYILTHGYKSYAHLFYARKRPPVHPEAHDPYFLIYGNTDKPVYLVSKIHKADEVLQMGGFHELYRKNGFVFFTRD
jgi:4-amino-4-deoxy-L-arabinose transferase-like glycosyltransferase